MEGLRVVAVILVVGASCSFDGVPPGASDGGGDSDSGVVDDGGRGGLPWWDADFAHRQRLRVLSASVAPDRGYLGYTVRLAGFDSAALVGAAELESTCVDLRVVVWDAGSWIELPRDVIDCDSADTSIAFALPTDVGVDSDWRDAFLYYGNPAAGPGPSVTATNVYLWWDDAATDSLALYDRGRMDAWLGTGHQDSLVHNAAGYYEYSTGDDSQLSLRRAVDERDVLVEAEFMHTDCFPNNMQTGVCVRGIIASGNGATESSDHYYCSTRAQNPNCSDIDQGLYDGDIVESDNEQISVQGVADPPPIVPDQWRKQALAAFATNPTELRFWDSDDGWTSRGYPGAATLQASGSDSDDYEGRGFAAIMTSQDAAQVRNIVVRRYIEPEPQVTVLGPAQTRP